MARFVFGYEFPRIGLITPGAVTITKPLISQLINTFSMLQTIIKSIPFSRQPRSDLHSQLRQFCLQLQTLLLRDTFYNYIHTDLILPEDTFLQISRAIFCIHLY
jgi:hypothetical protein